MKRWTKIALAVLVIVVIMAALIPFFVNADRFRPGVEKQLTARLGRSVKIGDLKFSVFSGRLVAENISVSDDPSFSTGPFLTAKEVRIGVDLLPLILSRQVNLRSFQIEAPQINPIRAANGTWNFSSIGRRVLASGAASAEMAAFSIGRIAIDDGRVIVASLPANGAPSVYDHVNVTARDFSFSSQFPFEFNADLPAVGTVSATGHAGPINPDDAAGSPIDAEISLKHLDPLGAGFLNRNAGLSFLADIDMHAASDGQTLATSGTGQIQNLKLSKNGIATTEPLDVAFDYAHQLKDSTGRIKEATVKIGDATIRASGTYQLIAPTLDNSLLNLKLVGQKLPIDVLQPLATAAAIRLPNGSRLEGGMLSMNLAVAGPAKSLSITGPIAFDGTKLVGFDIGSKIHGIAALAGVKTGDTASFQNLSMDVHMTDSGVVVDGIEGIVAGLGTFSGTGTVSPTDQLDCHLLVHVEGGKGIAKVGADLLAKLNGTGGSGNGSGVPMHVTGPSNDPSITADLGSVLGKKTKPALGDKKASGS